MTFKNAENIFELKNAFEIISNLDNSYPNFYDWYWNKVVPGIWTGNDEVVLAYKKDEIIGVSILKNSGEKKLRALRIKEKFQSKGFGLYLIDESLKRLNIDKPLCSVSEKMINDYSRIFINRYQFDISHVYKGLYKKGELEYEFNGRNIEADLKVKTPY